MYSTLKITDTICSINPINACIAEKERALLLNLTATIAQKRRSRVTKPKEGSLRKKNPDYVK